MLTNVVCADIFRPAEKVRALIYDVVLIIIGSLVIAASAQIAVGWPVPITGQTFAVLMIGVLFGSKRGSLTVLAYILEGLSGFAFFAQGKAGFIALGGPTGGYLIGFIFAAYIVGLLAEKGWDKRIETTILTMIFGNLIIYAFGLSWLFVLAPSGKLTDAKGILAVGLYPFIIGDIIKIALATALLPAGWKLLNKINITKRNVNQ
jgi:biotin transporter BioY